MVRIRWAIAALLSIPAASVQALPTGAVVCSVTSNFSGITMSRTFNQNPGPYDIVASTSTYTPGGQVPITLFGQIFSGVLIYATDVSGTQVYGTFSPGTPNLRATSAAECTPDASRLTHTTSWTTGTTSIVANWNAPATSVGDIYFTAYILSGDRGNFGGQQFFRILPTDIVATLKLTAANSQPNIAATAVSRRAGDAAAIVPVATASDAEQSPQTLTYTVNGSNSATVNAITLGALSANAGGIVSGTVSALCNATDAAFTVRASDSAGAFRETTVNVTVSPNLPPAFAYAASSFVFGESRGVSPTSGPTDSGTVSTTSVQDAGTFAGSVSVNGGAVVSIGNAAPVGSHTVRIAATDNCGATGTADLALTVAKASTSLAISDATDPTVNGTSVMIDSTLSVLAPGAGTPGGNIAVTGTGTTGCTITAPATQCTLVFTASGTQTLQASYAGETSFNGATATGITHTVTPGANLSVTKDDARSSLVSGSTVDYLIEVRNAGPDAVSNARLLDPAPTGLGSVAWTCTPVPPATCPAPSGTGSLDAQVTLGVNQGLDYVLSGTVTAAPGATVTNTASIATPAGTTETDAGNNTASDSDPVVASGIFANGFEN